jgi:hypothetical protein
VERRELPVRLSKNIAAVVAVPSALIVAMLFMTMRATGSVATSAGSLYQATPVANDAGVQGRVAALETRVTDLEEEVALLREVVVARAGQEGAAVSPGLAQTASRATPLANPVSGARETITTAGVGETVVVQDRIGDRYELTVVSVDRQRIVDPPGVHPIEATGAFIVVKFAVTNLGTTATFLAPEEWTIVDGEGRSFGPSFGTFLRGDIDAPKEPGVRYELFMNFDVDVTAADLTLLIEGTDIAIDLGY